MTIHDWHNPHNEDCPQNKHWDRDCNCKRRRIKKVSKINRTVVRDELLKMANSGLAFPRFTQVRGSTLDEIGAFLDAHLRKLAVNAPKRGKTL